MCIRDRNNFDNISVHSKEVNENNKTMQTRKFEIGKVPYRNIYKEQR